MGAPLWILVMVIVLVAVAFVLWALFAAGRGAASAAKSIKGHDSGETAAHSTEHTKIRRVDTTPPDETPDK
ncbi:hypothetical protein E1218_26875 [Kribbella turkmenica]|uniref:Uncharacterized protein n=1 Tax=Kribbella turkmenica TaxID=2530375 RepID=A0A4R4WMP3_9ACTN|nr:hypothetical protein [Kribbella turkmenica]TDD18004.1 hypothetical protein E1218_26875 [Kribbella turkmenica]